jgi:hypothetical protein
LQRSSVRSRLAQRVRLKLKVVAAVAVGPEVLAEGPRPGKLARAQRDRLVQAKAARTPVRRALEPEGREHPAGREQERAVRAVRERQARTIRHLVTWAVDLACWRARL